MWSSLDDSEDYEPKRDLIGNFITMFALGFMIGLLIF